MYTQLYLTRTHHLLTVVVVIDDGWFFVGEFWFFASYLDMAGIGPADMRTFRSLADMRVALLHKLVLKGL